LSKELAPFNINVTAIAPRSFRSGWAGRSMIRSPRRTPDYDTSFDSIRQAREVKASLADREESRTGTTIHAKRQ
jgi:NAD(P)-dependent dehydrogenase (short-subunit alcohol dehydrogenase family)